MLLTWAKASSSCKLEEGLSQEISAEAGKRDFLTSICVLLNNCRQREWGVPVFLRRLP
jgi:hypothetical protein